MLFASQPLLLAAQAACTPSQLFVVAVCVDLLAYCPKKIHVCSFIDLMGTKERIFDRNWWVRLSVLAH